MACRSILRLCWACAIIGSPAIPLVALANEPSPSAVEILRTAQSKYDSMQSYSSTGEITSSFSTPGMRSQESRHSFSIKLGRPQLYKIEWEQTSPNFLTRGSAWSQGNGHFVLVPGKLDPERLENAETALAMATRHIGRRSGDNSCRVLWFGA